MPWTNPLTVFCPLLLLFLKSRWSLSLLLLPCCYCCWCCCYCCCVGAFAVALHLETHLMTANKYTIMCALPFQVPKQELLYHIKPYFFGHIPLHISCTSSVNFCTMAAPEPCSIAARSPGNTGSASRTCDSCSCCRMSQSGGEMDYIDCARLAAKYDDHDDPNP